MSNFFKEKNVEIIRINLSTPFIIRSKCKECGKSPSIYYYIRNRPLWFSPQVARDFLGEFIKKHTKRMCTNYYLWDNPSDYRSVSDFAHTVDYKGYKCKLYKNRGVHPVHDCIEYLSCECGGSIWAFYHKSAKNRPEILNRKARSSFPQNFEY